jgi:protein TonB
VRASWAIALAVLVVAATPACAHHSKAPAGGMTYQPPRRLKLRPVPYPKKLVDEHVEADVPVAVSIDKTGRVTEVKILKATPYPEIDEAARKFALEEQYQPATRDGVPIPWTIEYTIRFRLAGQ